MTTNAGIWRVWARIAGPALPSVPVFLDGVRLSSAPDNAPVELAAPDVSSSAARFTVSHSARPEVRSPYWAVAQVRAHETAEAFRIADEELFPRIAAILSATVEGPPYQFQTIGTEGIDGSYSHSPLRAALFYEDESLPTSVVELAQERLSTVDADPRLKRALQAFERGIALSTQVGGAVTTAAAILAYFQVLEACAHVVPWERPRDFEEQRSTILRRVRASLSSRQTDSKKAASVHTADAALSRLDAKYTSTRIAHTARQLGLPMEWMRRAEKLGKFRNQRLGHAAEPPSMEELAEWVPNPLTSSSAHAVARALLTAAIDYVRHTPAR